jgi:hypothetical protein
MANGTSALRLRRKSSRIGTLLFSAGFASLVAGAGHASEWGDTLALDPPNWDWNGIDLTLGGSASGAVYTEHASSGPARPDGFDASGGTGEVRANARLERTLDNGIVMGARTNLLLAHDTLSDDRYGDDTFEKAYVYVKAGYGTLELGEQDGVGAQLGLTGPRLAPRVSLDDPDTSFFLNPMTGKRFDGFRPFSAVDSSLNDAKINYLTPRLFGLQLGVSYTPSMIKEPLPFIGNPSDAADTQSSIIEGAASYTTYIDNIALGFSASLLEGSLDHASKGHDNISDWALGAEAADTFGGVKVTLGGGYRESNAYAFQPAAVYSNGDTHLLHTALTAQKNSWSVGGEYSTAKIKGPASLSAYTMNAYQAGVGYAVNGNLDLTAGWQWYDYSRNSGTFYNGRDHIAMNAGFLALNYGL